MSKDKSAEDRIRRCRTLMLMGGNESWGNLSLNLRLEETDQGTLSTNGSVLRYNPAWLETVSDRELMGGIAHETGHCMLGHPWRIGGRDIKQFNVACDLALNPLLIASGFTLPEGSILDPQYDGMAAEQIYALRQTEEKKQPGGDGDGKDRDGQDWGEFEQWVKDGDGNGDGNRDGKANPKDMTEIDWTIATEQEISRSRKAGTLPGGLARLIKESRESRTDWRTVLRQFVAQAIPSDYSWAQPNPRYISMGLYLPGIIKDNKPRLGIAVDTSGSISPSILDVFGKELEAILREVRPEGLDVVYSDYSVQIHEEFECDDEIALHPTGGGGTRFQPALDWFSKMDEPPACVVYLTDLENFGEKLTEPWYPVLWAVPATVRRNAPFGTLVILEEL